MFKPPDMDNDDFSPFGGKSGLFSGGRGLFDDDDEVCRVSLCIRTQCDTDTEFIFHATSEVDDAYILTLGVPFIA